MPSSNRRPARWRRVQLGPAVVLVQHVDAGDLDAGADRRIFASALSSADLGRFGTCTAHLRPSFEPVLLIHVEAPACRHRDEERPACRGSAPAATSNNVDAPLPTRLANDHEGSPARVRPLEIGRFEGQWPTPDQDIVDTQSRTICNLVHSLASFGWRHRANHRLGVGTILDDNPTNTMEHAPGAGP